MKFTKVKTSKVFIEKFLTDNLAEVFPRDFPHRKVFIITDSNVAALYLEKIIRQISKMGFEVHDFVINSGEKYKSLKTAEEIYSFLSLNLISRSDLIVSLGGGVVTDISGFVASTYKRGIPLIHIPTSFLAMIDASIGGKNGVNLDYGKNLIGTFYHPDFVLIDPSLTETLPERELNSGIAEAIKCGAIKDRKLFEILEHGELKDNFEQIILRSINVKKELVEKDEFDFSERMLLNFGHTFGHALEKLSGFKSLTHGEAVSIGMNMITKISESLGLTEKGTSGRLSVVCKKYLLPISSDFSLSEICEAALSDKKIINGLLNFIMIRSIGEAFANKTNVENMRGLMNKEGNKS